MGAQNTQENRTLMAQEKIEVEFVFGSNIQKKVQEAIDRIQAKGGRIMGPVSLTVSGILYAALITYAIPAGD